MTRYDLMRFLSGEKDFKRTELKMPIWAYVVLIAPLVPGAILFFIILSVMS